MLQSIVRDAGRDTNLLPSYTIKTNRSPNTGTPIMPATRRRSSSISKDSIEQASSALQQLPEKPRENLSLREAIAALQDTITTALDRGYSYDEVAALLSDQGVRISPTSLKSYLADSQRNKNPHTRRTTRRRRSSTEEQPELEISEAMETPEAPDGTEIPETSEVPEPATRGRRRRSSAVATEPASKSTRGRRSTTRKMS